MSPIFALHAIARLKPGAALDIGARDCRIANRLVELGYSVDAIEPNPQPGTELAEGITFHRTKLEDFEADQLYDLVVASMVSQLVDLDLGSYLARLRSLVRADGLIYVTLIGDEDEWAGIPSAKAVSYDDACALIAEEGLTPLYRSNERFEGRVYSGETKSWHLYRFVLEMANSVTCRCARSAKPGNHSKIRLS